MIKRHNTLKTLNWFAAGLALLVSGCASMPNFPVFGSKPPPVAANKTTGPPPAAAVPEGAESTIHPPPPPTESPFQAPAETNIQAAGKPRPGNNQLPKAESAEPGLPIAAESWPLVLKFNQERLKWYQGKSRIWQQLHADLTETTAIPMPPEFNDCLNQTAALIRGYEAAANQTKVAPSAGELYRLDINYLASDCEQIRAQSADALKAGIKKWRQTAKREAASRVRGYLQQNHPQQAVQAYTDFINLYGPKAVDADLSKAYELALKRLGRFREAAALLSEPGHKKGIEDEISRADLLMAAGSDEEAKTLYKELSQKIAQTLQYQEWAKNQLSIINQDQNSDLFPVYIKLLGAYYRADTHQTAKNLKSELAQIQAVGSDAMRANAVFMAKKMAAVTAQWRQRQLNRLDELLAGGEFTKAGVLLDQLSSLLSPEEVTNQRQRIKEAVDNARQQQIIEQKRQTDKEWRQALDLLDRQKYKAAIGVLKGLLNTTYGPEAEKKLAAASNMAAEAMRREAAALFLKAGRTADPLTVEKMMLQARDLLRQAIVEYPDVKIIDKIKQNLRALDKQLNKFTRHQ
ncbi:MAG TPA: hypothetical protein ENK33_05555 [Desulfobacterales bacterium]|nr:hypothetical protein [Desulfobacterales bacterium]